MRDHEIIANAATRDDAAPQGTEKLRRSPIEQAGVLEGEVLAPEVKLGARARHSRLFHPTGIVFSAEVHSAVPEDHLRARAVARRLSGHAVVRFSGAIWKHSDRWPDALGCAIRFCEPGRELDPGRTGQDLLLATIRSPATLFLAPLATRTHDYLVNRYYGAAPFLLEGVGRVKVRLRSEVRARSLRSSTQTRADRLAVAVEEDPVRLLLEWKHHYLPELWRPLLEITLLQQLEIDQRLLRFNPFLTGRGIHPRGFVHAMRRATYPASRIGSGEAMP